MRRQQRARKAKQNACLRCFPLLRVSEQLPEGLRANVRCPFCGRELKLVVDSALLETEAVRDQLHTYGALVESAQGLKDCRYTFTLDGEELLADPPCACGEPCNTHPHLEVIIETDHSEALRVFAKKKSAGEKVTMMRG